MPNRLRHDLRRLSAVSPVHLAGDEAGRYIFEAARRVIVEHDASGDGGVPSVPCDLDDIGCMPAQIAGEIGQMHLAPLGLVAVKMYRQRRDGAQTFGHRHFQPRRRTAAAIAFDALAIFQQHHALIGGQLAAMMDLRRFRRGLHQIDRLAEAFLEDGGGVEQIEIEIALAGWLRQAGDLRRRRDQTRSDAIEAQHALARRQIDNTSLDNQRHVRQTAIGLVEGRRHRLGCLRHHFRRFGASRQQQKDQGTFHCPCSLVAVRVASPWAGTLTTQRWRWASIAVPDWLSSGKRTESPQLSCSTSTDTGTAEALASLYSIQRRWPEVPKRSSLTIRGFTSMSKALLIAASTLAPGMMSEICVSPANWASPLASLMKARKAPRGRRQLVPDPSLASKRSIT